MSSERPQDPQQQPEPGYEPPAADDIETDRGPTAAVAGVQQSPPQDNV